MDLRLIVITDTRLAAPRTVEDVLRSALEAGAPAVQLRNKAASGAELYQEALAVRKLTRQFGALLFINDRLDVALAADADGVHLGPADIPVAASRIAARKAGRPHFIIGASTDHPEHAAALAAEGADYIGCGAVFGTTSKPDVAGERIGTERLRQVVNAVAVPVVGIGGITPDNVADVAAAGARGAAVIAAVMAADDPGAAVQALLAPFKARGSD
jgi:thiamine-phosphate pyrophosphorylase